eukprot:364768-Chlamydomonas_euryale.AAC.7
MYGTCACAMWDRRRSICAVHMHAAYAVLLAHQPSLPGPPPLVNPAARSPIESTALPAWPNPLAYPAARHPPWKAPPSVPPAGGGIEALLS